MDTKVFGIGLHKTGTSTLNYCLGLLGYKTCPQILGWRWIIDSGEDALLYEIANTYEGFQDSPWHFPNMYKKLEEWFPGSKFILTTRDVDNWETSFERSVLRTPIQKVHRAITKTLYGMAGQREAFLAHNETVIEYFSGRQDFLVVDWEAGDGWAQLCPFLGKPIPDKPFPHRNKYLSEIEKHKEMVSRMLSRFPKKSYDVGACEQSDSTENSH